MSVFRGPITLSRPDLNLLQHYFSFDSSGLQYIDIHGDGEPLVSNGVQDARTVDGGIYGKYLDCSGSDSKRVSGDYTLASENYTINLWAKRPIGAPTSTFGQWIYNWRGVGSDIKFSQIFLDPEPHIRFGVRDSSDLTWNEIHADYSLISDNNWHMYTLSIDNDNSLFRGYIDGDLISGQTLTNGLMTGTISLAYGFTSWSILKGSNFDSEIFIDEASIWSGALNEKEIYWLYSKGRGKFYKNLSEPSLRDGLVAWWRLDEPNGTRIDAHNGITLTDNNTVPSVPDAIRNGGANFAYTNTEYLSLDQTLSSGLAITGAMTIGCWYRNNFTGDTTIRGIVARQSAPNNDRAYMLARATNKINWYVNNNPTSNTYSMVSNVEYGANVWNFIVGVFEPSSRFEIYINGSGTVDPSVAPSCNIANSNFNIGTQDPPHSIRSLYGDVDEVFVYSRALSSGEILQLYNNGSGLTYSELP